jgi:hypothetical protein
LAADTKKIHKRPTIYKPIEKVASIEGTTSVEKTDSEEPEPQVQSIKHIGNGKFKRGEPSIVSHKIMWEDFVCSLNMQYLGIFIYSLKKWSIGALPQHMYRRSHGSFR